MITKIETARIVALGGYAELELEECSDGILNIKIKEYADNKIRIGIPESWGVQFRFLKDFKTPNQGERV